MRDIDIRRNWVEERRERSYKESLKILFQIFLKFLAEKEALKISVLRRRKVILSSHK